MDISRYATRSLMALPLMAVAVTGITPVTAAATGPHAVGRGSFLTLSGSLQGVTATSTRNAWAVGFSSTTGSLIVHWNGRAWTRVPSPTPGGGTDLRGVAAVSARSAWAVGFTGQGSSVTKTLVLRWNGTSWTRVPSLAPAASSSLLAVATTPGGRAWAVGNASNSRRTRFETLILRWNGKAWK